MVDVDDLVGVATLDEYVVFLPGSFRNQLLNGPMAAVLLNRIFLSLGRGDGLTQLQHMEAVAVHLNWPLYVGNFEDERMPVPVIQTDDPDR